MFIAPIIVLPFSKDVSAIVGTLVVGRWVLSCILFLIVAQILSRFPVTKGKVRPEIGTVVKASSWMTVSNIVSPVMTYMDRFIVASAVGVVGVAYYTTPYDLISRLSFIPEAAFTVIFSRMSKLYATEKGTGTGLLSLVSRIVNSLTFPLSVIIVSSAPLFLTIWIDADFSSNSAPILVLLAAGFFVNNAARPYYNALQAFGRADITAKIHLMELPIYLILLTTLVHMYGIFGAALAWVARAALDFALLAAAASISENKPKASIVRIVPILVLTLALAALGQVPDDTLRYLIAAMAIFIQLAMWKVIFSSEQRSAIGLSFRTVTARFRQAA
jgi:O-antigen/teichoic acid export membrane protein